MGKNAEKTLSLWHDRISTSKKWRQQIAEQNNWETYIDEYNGIYDVVLGNQFIPPINEVFAYVESTKANLFASDPYMAVNPRKDATIDGAVILEALINYDWQQLKVKDEIELQIMDCVLVGHAWNKVGNNVKTSGSGDQLKLESESIYSNRVSWRDMLINIGARRPMVDALWMAQRIYRPTEDVKKDYGSVAAHLSGSAYPDLDERMKKEMLYKDDINFSALWEIWDARERKIYLIADETTKDFLDDPKPWPDYLKSFPYQMLSFNEIPDKPYPMSDIASWNPQVLEKIKIFTMMLNHIKRWNRQMVAKKGTMTIQELDKFEKGLDGTILLASTNGDIQSAFKMIDFGSLPPDIYIILDRLDQVIRKMNGQPEFEQGGNTKTGTRTLGELQLIKGGAGARTNRKQDRIENHCENIARQIMAHRKNNLDLGMVVKITGNEPQLILQAFQDQGKYNPVTRTIQFSKEDIQGEYDITVKSGSTLPLDKGTRDQILSQVYQDSIPLASAQSIPPFLAEIVKERLRDYGIKGLEQAFDQQMQAAAQNQQNQVQVQEAQVAKTDAETQKRQEQAKQINADTVIKTAQALGRASGDIHPELSLTK